MARFARATHIKSERDTQSVTVLVHEVLDGNGETESITYYVTWTDATGIVLKRQYDNLHDAVESQRKMVDLAHDANP